MQALQEITEEEVVNSLPPLISFNLREKLQAEQVSIVGLTQAIRHRKTLIQHEEEENLKSKSGPKPQHGLEVIWCPNVLDFEINDVEVLCRLRIWNPCPRSIYLHCCGFWDETCRLGAVWRCYPRTRLLLAPGLSVNIYVKATPRDFCPIAHTTTALQLAAAHKRDHIVAYFVVPIRVTFLKYLPPSPFRGE